MDYLWILLLLFTLWPMMTQLSIRIRRQRLIQRLEFRRKSRVIVLIHRQETFNILGIPIYRFINIEDSEEILRAIKLTDVNIPIDLIVHTPGGLLLPASQIAKALQRHQGKVTVFVPHYAMSGGTLIALAADEIIMDENAVLGPVDPQLGQFPAASIIRAARLKPPETLDDQTLITLDVAEKALQQVESLVFELIQNKLPEDKARKLAHLLAEGHWTHDRPITYEELTAWGFQVTKEVPGEIYELMRLHPQPMRRVSGVEYIPVPYRKT